MNQKPSGFSRHNQIVVGCAGIVQTKTSAIEPETKGFSRHNQIVVGCASIVQTKTSAIEPKTVRTYNVSGCKSKSRFAALLSPSNHRKILFFDGKDTA